MRYNGGTIVLRGNPTFEMIGQGLANGITRGIEDARGMRDNAAFADMLMPQNAYSSGAAKQSPNIYADAPVVVNNDQTTASQAPPPVTAPIAQAPTWADTQNQYRADFAAKLKMASGKMGPQAFRQALPVFMDDYKQGLATAKADFDKQEMGRSIDAFDAEQDPRKKIALGLKSGLIGKEGAMLLVQPGTETKVINTGGENVVVGYNKFTGRYVNLKDGAEIDPQALQEMLKPTMNPAQADASARGWRQLDISASRGPGGGGGGDNGMSAADTRQFNAANAIVKQHEAWMQHRKDITGQMPNDADDPNWGIVQQAKGIVQGHLNRMAGVGEQGNSGGGTVDYYQGMKDVTEAIARNNSAPAGQKWNRQQFESYIQQKYGDLAPYIIRDALGEQQQGNSAPNQLAMPNQFDPNELDWGLPKNL